MVNIGINGLIGIAYVLLVGGDLNGPTLGGIFTIMGFSAFGKHPRNIIPVMFGVWLGAYGMHYDPITRRFSWRACSGPHWPPLPVTSARYAAYWRGSSTRRWCCRQVARWRD